MRRHDGHYVLKHAQKAGFGLSTVLEPDGYHLYLFEASSGRIDCEWDGNFHLSHFWKVARERIEERINQEA